MTTKLNLFDPYLVDDQAIILASHLPIGRVWQKGFLPDSNIGKLIRGLAVEFYRFQVLTQNVSVEMDINQTNELLIEWEKSVGLPDSCFVTNVSIEERRKQVEQKFTNFGGVQIADDFERVASVFGFTVKIFPGIYSGGFPLRFPITFFDSTKSAKHTIFGMIMGELTGDAFFPLPFPIPFSLGGTTFLECIFNLLAPANVNVVIVSEGDL